MSKSYYGRNGGPFHRGPYKPVMSRSDLKRTFRNHGREESTLNRDVRPPPRLSLETTQIAPIRCDQEAVSETAVLGAPKMKSGGSATTDEGILHAARAHLQRKISAHLLVDNISRLWRHKEREGAEHKKGKHTPCPVHCPEGKAKRVQTVDSQVEETQSDIDQGHLSFEASTSSLMSASARSPTYTVTSVVSYNERTTWDTSPFSRRPRIRRRNSSALEASTRAICAQETTLSSFDPLDIPNDHIEPLPYANRDLRAMSVQKTDQSPVNVAQDENSELHGEHAHEEDRAEAASIQRRVSTDADLGDTPPGMPRQASNFGFKWPLKTETSDLVILSSLYSAPLIAFLLDSYRPLRSDPMREAIHLGQRSSATSAQISRYLHLLSWVSQGHALKGPRVPIVSALFIYPPTLSPPLSNTWFNIYRSMSLVFGLSTVLSFTIIQWLIRGSTQEQTHTSKRLWWNGHPMKGTRVVLALTLIHALLFLLSIGLVYPPFYLDATAMITALISVVVLASYAWCILGLVVPHSPHRKSTNMCLRTFWHKFSSQLRPPTHNPHSSPKPDIPGSSGRTDEACLERLSGVLRERLAMLFLLAMYWCQMKARAREPCEYSTHVPSRIIRGPWPHLYRALATGEENIPETHSKAVCHSVMRACTLHEQRHHAASFHFHPPWPRHCHRPPHSPFFRIVPVRHPVRTVLRRLSQPYATAATERPRCTKPVPCVDVTNIVAPFIENPLPTCLISSTISIILYIHYDTFILRLLPFVHSALFPASPPFFSTACGPCPISRVSCASAHVTHDLSRSRSDCLNCI